MHVLVTKPPVKTLREHNELAELARQAGRLCAIEVHKRFDPIYAGRASPSVTPGPSPNPSP